MIDQSEGLSLEKAMPLLPPRSTMDRMAHFGETVYNISPVSHLFKLVSALCGDGGAGHLKRQLLTGRLGNQLEGLHFHDLDRLYSGTLSFGRLNIESYPWDPTQDMLTSTEWDEVMVKDAWYRARVRDFWRAAQLGGTPDGMKMAVMSALGVECEIFEVWRYIDNYGLTENLGRTAYTLRNEFVLKPLMGSLTPEQKHLALRAIDAIKPVDSIVTIDVEGLMIHTEVVFRTVAASNSYFEVQKTVTGTPDLALIPPPVVLPGQVLNSETWMKPSQPVQAPHGAFNYSQEYSLVHTAGREGSPSATIDSVVYQVEEPDGSVRLEDNYTVFKDVPMSWGPFFEYELADSPDNFPGGRNGQTPHAEPALMPDGRPYKFAWESQQHYVEVMKARVLARGGRASDLQYQLPMSTETTMHRQYLPDQALPVEEPARESSVVSSWYGGN